MHKSVLVCTLAVYLRTFREYPLVVAANRDEFFDRESFGPELVPSEPPIYCGRDGVHGGTWLGVNADGVVAALLNRRTLEPPNPALRSRGLLCLEALRYSSAAEALRAFATIDADSYNAFNLLIADAQEASVLSNSSRRMARIDLVPGLHLLTNLDVDDPECPRIAASTRRFAALRDGGDPNPERLVERLHTLLASHDVALDPRDPAPGNALCVHLETFGTRSSTILLLNRRLEWTYRHCPCAPCRGEYLDEPVAERFTLQRSRA
jgi:uncharacterized protein with NRDE domain